VSESAAAAVAEADIICTVTAASEPVLLGKYVRAGAHVNAVGACTPRMRELDAELVVRARLFADRRESCLREPGDIVAPLREGLINEDHVQAPRRAIGCASWHAMIRSRTAQNGMPMRRAAAGGRRRSLASCSRARSRAAPRRAT
jgi:hypothetical protein